MTAGNVVLLTTANWAEEVQNSSVPVLVDFGAVWCPPCRVIEPIVAELAREYADRIKVGSLDVDANTAIADKFGVMSLPTLLVLKGGEEIERLVGFRPFRELKAWLDGVLS